MESTSECVGAMYHCLVLTCCVAVRVQVLWPEEEAESASKLESKGSHLHHHCPQGHAPRPHPSPHAQHFTAFPAVPRYHPTPTTRGNRWRPFEAESLYSITQKNFFFNSTFSSFVMTGYYPLPGYFVPEETLYLLKFGCADTAQKQVGDQ